MSNPPRSQRLRSAAEFARVLSGGRRLRGNICTIVQLPADGGPARLGLAISRKASPLAVRRNRIKRLSRACFLHQSPDRGWYVVMARPGAGKCSDEAIRNDLNRLWRRTDPSSQG